MPLIHYGDELPAWCEMRAYEIIHLLPGEIYNFARIGPKEKLLVESGRCRISFGDQTIDAERGTNINLTTPEGHFAIRDVTEAALLLRVARCWGDVTGGSGLWVIENSHDPHDKGDPVDYPKSTDFDSHYHDYDEYWIFFSGRGIAISEGSAYEIGPGYCIATGMGHHHDLAQVYEPIRAAFFETTLGGKGRRGHLWNHTHGPAEPQPGRV